MKMEERSVNKKLYRIEIFLLKTTPVGMMLCSIGNTILGYLGMETAILSFTGGLSKKLKRMHNFTKELIECVEDDDMDYEDDDEDYRYSERGRMSERRGRYRRSM